MYDEGLQIIALFGLIFLITFVIYYFITAHKEEEEERKLEEMERQYKEDGLKAEIDKLQDELKDQK